jgi:hypothetical protein
MKLGRELFSWAMSSEIINQLITIFIAPFLIKIYRFLTFLTPILALKKTDGSWFFDPHFDQNCHFWHL